MFDILQNDFIFWEKRRTFGFILLSIVTKFECTSQSIQVRINTFSYSNMNALPDGATVDGVISYIKSFLGRFHPPPGTFHLLYYSCNAYFFEGTLIMNFYYMYWLSINIYPEKTKKMICMSKKAPKQTIKLI